MVEAPGKPGALIRFIAADAAATELLGAQVAARSTPGLRIFLDGELGTGKTTFVRGFLASVGHEGAVRSPTYTLVEPYRTRIGPVFHFDLYRLVHPRELEALGYRDYFDGSGICLVEWARRGGPLLGTPDLHVLFSPQDSGRLLTFEAQSDTGVAAIPPLLPRVPAVS
ncbi:MAG: tRNA (adenosine(37)-N6)-threonylcarbamoyltransferase complex ATPase subunit type 1 TsaE [Gammaproteobacteria bacterium]|nr:tRNA (adenosine(37)-N6)-threonylcarbamoyltransferase complex ATPase subunit type 1 TsaE [Gammaproteobacteria bacterium]